MKRLALLAALLPPVVLLGLAACGEKTPPKEAGPPPETTLPATSDAPPPTAMIPEAPPKPTASASAAVTPKPAGTVKMLGKAQDEDVVEMNASNCGVLEDKYRELALADQRKQRRTDTIKDEAKKAKAEDAALAEADRVAKPFGNACRENLAGKAAQKSMINCFQASTSIKAFLACQK